MNPLIAKTEKGFSTLKVNPVYTKAALGFLEDWLEGEDYKDYRPQIEQLIAKEQWNYLLDSFYQIIPFGTGGRRGEVGVGPNRINPWTIQASAQGHSQYLLKKYRDDVKKRGVVFAYDTREFSGNKYLDDNLLNPVKSLTSKDLAVAAARVYAANGIKVYIFDGIRTTPELSFAIRHLGAAAGDMFSASHNPPSHNGKKVYDDLGGQLTPPDDEDLVVEVTQNVEAIKEIPYEEAMGQGLIQEIGALVDDEYIKAATSISLSEERDLKIVYTPLHGCGITSVYVALQKLGFDVMADPKTSNISGKFENVTFNIPNPEVIQSFDTTLKYAKENEADIILNSDPDADRIGIMVKHQGNWVFVNGNDIAAILSEYAIEKRKDQTNGKLTIVKTTVTTNLIKKICEKNQVDLIGELLIGFKYIAGAMNELEAKGDIDGFLLGCEESHGYLAGNYARDKDAVTPAVWLSELAAELKKKSETLIDYLDRIYAKYGYFRNYLTEVRLLGVSGKEKIDATQASLRKNPPQNFGEFEVEAFEDCMKREPIVSDTDRSAKDVLIFNLKAKGGADTIKVTVRPSGTEPKVKMYFEIGTEAVAPEKLDELKENIDSLLHDLEKAVMLTCYKIIGVDFPDRGFLLFWQLPLDDKMKYFEIEPKIELLKKVEDKREREAELFKLISFLGSNPVEKMDDAFKAKYSVSVRDYLGI